MKVKREAICFMHRKKVLKTTYQKVLRYIDHVYETDSLTSFSQFHFMDRLSESLQSELRLEITGNFLRKFPLFQESGDSFVKTICPICRTVRAGKGDIVAQQGQANEEMFMIVQGEVRFSNMKKQLGALQVEDWFGERALFSDGLIHNATMRCETDCEFLVIARRDFLEAIAQFPSVLDEYEALLNDMPQLKIPNGRRTSFLDEQLYAHAPNSAARGVERLSRCSVNSTQMLTSAMMGNIGLSSSIGSHPGARSESLRLRGRSLDRTNDPRLSGGSRGGISVGGSVDAGRFRRSSDAPSNSSDSRESTKQQEPAIASI